MSANIKQYRHAFDVSQALVDVIEISEYPINMFRVFERKKGPPILVSSFKDYKLWAKSTGRNCPDEVKDAKCYLDEKTGAYIVVYNEKKTKKRIRFSLAHELGHIILNHLNDERTEIDRGGLGDIAYYAMEGAANTFAGNFLAPPILIHERLAGGHFDVDDVANFFDLSKQSVRNYRKQDYQCWLSMSHGKREKRILERYIRRLNTFLCNKCGSVFTIKGAKYCPVCGNQPTKLRAGGNGTMGRTYPHIELNENGRVKECPLCKNEEHLKGALFCMICSKPAVNQCTFAIEKDYEGYRPQCEHTEPLPGNARYCPYCGNETTFLQSGLLQKWDVLQTPPWDEDMEPL